MNRILVSTVILLFTFPSFSQQSDNWYFGVLAGVNFTQGAPVALSNGMLNTNEGCSSVSDSLGNLLFYTDGITVWNKNHAAMPNGTGLLGGISSTQSALVVPKPGSNTLYYIFTVDETGGPNGFRYSIVDMTLQGSLGDVTSKNVLVLINVTEKLTAVRHGNGISYWIAVHEWGSNAFYVYELNSFTFSTIPIVSNTGSVHNTTVIQNTYGQMKFSPCGDRLALAIGYQDAIEISDFNLTTGAVANPVSLGMTDHVYGIEFSESGQILYASTYDPLETLVQLDLSSGNAATILATKTMLSQASDIYALLMAPDKRIYVAKSFSSFLGTITNPSSLGTACTYVDMSFNLDPNFNGVISALGLPGFPQSYFREKTACITSANENETANPFLISPNPSSGKFLIEFKEDAPVPASIALADLQGKTVLRKTGLHQNILPSEMICRQDCILLN